MAAGRQWPGEPDADAARGEPGGLGRAGGALWDVGAHRGWAVRVTSCGSAARPLPGGRERQGYRRGFCERRTVLSGGTGRMGAVGPMK